jgi:hypothetical protein
MTGPSSPRCDECGGEAEALDTDGTFLCEGCALEANLDLEDLLDMAMRFQDRR